MSSNKICPQCGSEYGAEQRFCQKDGSPLRPVRGDDPLIGQVLADRYQILEVIGEGGMGRVYLAEHVRMGRRSALKVINPSLAVTAEAISRFNREASNASRINHPNVAQIYDFGETPDGILYLAMEFIEGETLTTIIEREGAIPLGQAGQIAKQIADALAAAHHLGIVHRDLKPDNIMVGRHLDGSDWVKVVDFGIAKTVQGRSGDTPSQTVTTAGVSLGTPEYMSPEQLAGERLDARTDIYSLGLVLFNMLTADLPYPRLTSKETLIRRLTSQPRTLAEVRPDIAWPAALQATLSRALAPEAADRFAGVAEFGQSIVQATADAIDSTRTVRISSVTGIPAVRESGASAGPGRTRHLTEPAASGRRGMLAGVVVGLLLAAGAAFAFVQHQRASTAATQGVPPAVGTVADSSGRAADSLAARKAATKGDSAPAKAAVAAAGAAPGAAPGATPGKTNSGSKPVADASTQKPRADSAATVVVPPAPPPAPAANTDSSARAGSGVAGAA
ncbi:MAG TPA: serine/threonine-protein kinase, partial [Gemmatimonadaceae bacterium]|nr:serine/threonine-protein kinase [Gemmatimonadaceae bacterium]